jgi:hypothetical protein
MHIGQAYKTSMQPGQACRTSIQDKHAGQAYRTSIQDKHAGRTSMQYTTARQYILHLLIMTMLMCLRMLVVMVEPLHKGYFIGHFLVVPLVALF